MPALGAKPSGALRRGRRLASGRVTTLRPHPYR